MSEPSRNGHAAAPLIGLDELDELEPIVDPSGWFSVQLRYAYLVGDTGAQAIVEDRVVLVDGDDEEAALGRAVELAAEYEDEFETADGQEGVIRFEGIVAIKELDDPPAAGTEVWHEFMAPAGVETDADGEPLPTVRPLEMAFPRAHDE
ncbi:MAG TPA: DUF4288 domain-containing protein [Candidatus Limnocylindria bacterium]